MDTGATQQAAVHPGKELKIYISPGNMKMGNIPSLSLPPIVTCHCTLCEKDCYAVKMQRLRKNVKASWARNWELYTTDPDSYWKQLDTWLLENKPERFRFNVSGDVPDQQYWVHIFASAVLFQDTRFLLFTKDYQGLSQISVAWRDFDWPKNLSIVVSRWPGDTWSPGGILPQHRVTLKYAWVKWDERKSAQLPPDYKIPDTAVPCSGSCVSCTMCWDAAPGTHVVFQKH